MSKYGVFSGPYFPVFGVNTGIYSVRIQENSDQKKLFGHFPRSTRISMCTVVAEILSWVPSKKHSIPLWVWLKLCDINLSIWTRCICKCSCNQRNTSLKFCANSKWFTYSTVEWSFSTTSLDLKLLSTSFALLFIIFFTITANGKSLTCLFLCQA